MTAWLQQFLLQSCAMSLVACAYMAATKWLRHRYDAKWFYMVGIVVLAGLVIPFRPTITVAPQNIPAFLSDGLRATDETDGATTAMQEDAVQGTPVPAKVLAVYAAGAVWLIGALHSLVKRTVEHRRFIRSVSRWCRPVSDDTFRPLLQEAKQRVGLGKRSITLLACPCLQSPMVVWMRGYAILLPNEHVAPDDGLFILLHELVHIRRHDLLVRILMLLVTSLHWCNPLVQLFAQQLTLDSEISCDTKVAAIVGDEKRHQYALSILQAAKVQAQTVSALTTAFYGNKDALKKRIESICVPGQRKLGASLLALAVALSLLAGTSIAMDGSAMPFSSTIAYSLPEGIACKQREALSSYTLRWEPMENITSYHIGLYFSLEAQSGKEYWAVQKGYMGPREFTDDEGTIHEVNDAVWESITLPGDATETDIAALINDHLQYNSIKLNTCTVTMVAVPTVGAPIQTSIAIPVEDA